MNTCLSITGTGARLRNLAVVALLTLTAGLVSAENHGAELNPSHPDSYVVQKGDTLWDISKMFLTEPWYWPEIWYVNPQVENPHLIYPGDTLKLVYIDGQPRIINERGELGERISRGRGERLSPRVREEALEGAITTIAYQDIRPFLAGGMVMDKNEAEELPYVAAMRDHMIAGAGNEVFLKDLPEDVPLGTELIVLRIDDELIDPETDRQIGNEIIFVGRGELRAQGDPATLFLTRTNREVRRGDRVRPADLVLPMNFFPKAPAQDIEGQIVSVVDGVQLIGQYQMIILNRGMEHGLEAGSVLAVYQSGERQRYGAYNSISAENVTLPDRLAGHVMVVKAYDDISYALVMEAESEMRVNDIIRTP